MQILTEQLRFVAVVTPNCCRCCKDATLNYNRVIQSELANQMTSVSLCLFVPQEMATNLPEQS